MTNRARRMTSGALRQGTASAVPKRWKSTRLLFGFSLGGRHYRFGVPEVSCGLGDLVRRIAQIRAEAVERGFRALLGVGHGLFELGHAFIAQDVLEHYFFVEVGERFAEEGNVVRAVVFAFDDLGKEDRLSVGHFVGVGIDFLDLGLKFRGMARANMNNQGAEDAGFTNKLGKSLRVGGHFAAEVGAAHAKLGVSAGEAAAPVSEEFLGAFLAEGLVERSHEGIVALVHIGVAVTLGDEDVGVDVAVDSLLDHDMITVVVAVGVSDFLGDGLASS